MQLQNVKKAGVSTVPGNLKTDSVMKKAGYFLFTITLLSCCVVQAACYAYAKQEKDESFRLTGTAQWYLLDCSEKLTWWPILADKEKTTSADHFTQLDSRDRLQKADSDLQEKVEDRAMPNKAEQPIFQAY